MFIKKSFIDEIAHDMQCHLVAQAVDKTAERQDRVVRAASHLNTAAELFDDLGLSAQSELVTAVLESLAGKKGKSKSKPGTKKVEDHKHTHDCEMCSDMSFIDDELSWWRLCLKKEPRVYQQFQATATSAKKRQISREEHTDEKWVLEGPFDTIADMESHKPTSVPSKIVPQAAEVNMAKDKKEDDGDLYALLENFKDDSAGMGFEDELDF